MNKQYKNTKQKRQRKRRSRNMSIDRDEEVIMSERRTESSLRFRGFIIPDHFYTHLKYVDQNLVIMSSAASGVQVYAQNDVFDPDVTSAGHQPLGFDQLGALWKRFRVHSSEIEIRPSTLGTGLLIGVIPSNSSTSPTTLNNLMEGTYSVYNTWYTGMGYDAVLRNHISTREISGLPSITQDDQFAGSTTASPARLFYWVINVQTSDGTNTTTRINSKIQYWVEFFDRVQLGQS